MDMVIKVSAYYFPFVVIGCVAHLCQIRQASGHGFLASPRSRNLHAYEQTKWIQQTSTDPEPENCPQCLNIGGELARCGIVRDSTSKRNYDAPRNALGGALHSTVQAIYIQGQDVILDVTLTAHHKGHFVFSACPIQEGEIPTQSCFDKYRLTFVEDLMHGAVLDPTYPERAYIAPVEHPATGGAPPKSYGPIEAMAEYSFKMHLPDDLYGDLVLIQWYYLTGNSCIHEGYLEYDWPWDYGWNMGGSDTPRLDKCGKVSNDGSGTPEQFWNCAEVKIKRSSNASTFANGSNSSKHPSKEKPNKKPAKKGHKKKKKRKKKKQQKPDRKVRHHVRGRIEPRDRVKRKKQYEEKNVEGGEGTVENS